LLSDIELKLFNSALETNDLGLLSGAIRARTLVSMARKELRVYALDVVHERLNLVVSLSHGLLALPLKLLNLIPCCSHFSIALSLGFYAFDLVLLRLLLDVLL